MSYELDSFLGFFEQADLDWIIGTSEHRQLRAGAVLIAQGGQSEGIYVLLEGALGISIKGVDETIAMVKPGQFVGEISFLDSRPTSATVTAHSDSKVLRIGRTELQARLGTHPRFAARFYQALGMRLAQIYRRELTGLQPAPVEKTAESVTASTLANMFHEACNKFATRQAYTVGEQWIIHGRPWFAKPSIVDGEKGEDCSRTFGLSMRVFSAVPDGICWLTPLSLTRTFKCLDPNGLCQPRSYLSCHQCHDCLCNRLGCTSPQSCVSLLTFSRTSRCFPIGPG